jgi:O-antigen/teichoic acid export membrane protein
LVVFAVNLILARLLLPEDFGTIALFNIVINVAIVLINGGLSSSLIRAQNVDNRDLSTVFWFNIVVSFYLLSYFYINSMDIRFL